MRFSVQQPSLAKGLSIVARAVSSRTTMPVLSNILLEAKGNQLRLAATNREIGINCWIGAKVEDEGAITIPARLLSEFVNSLPPERIDMDLTVRTQTLRLACARFEANLKGIDAFEFPLIPTVPSDGIDARTPIVDGAQMELTASGLRKMIDQVIFAASTDENRPTLTGVEVSFTTDRLSMAATDGYRLSVRRTPLSQGVDEGQLTVIVPARSLGEVARISVDADEGQPVRVIVTKERNQALFQLWGKDTIQRVELVSELIDARFPDYSATIPKSYSTRTVIDTASLLKAVRVALLFARDNANIVRLRVNPGTGETVGQVRLTATSAEMGDNVSELDATVEGNDLDIAFDAKYMIDALSRVDGPLVVETTTSTRPAALHPVGVEKDEFLYVLMPMNPQR